MEMRMKAGHLFKSASQIEWFLMLERFQAPTEDYVKQEVLKQIITGIAHIGLHLRYLF